MQVYPTVSLAQLSQLRKLNKRRDRAEQALFLAEGHRTVQQLLTNRRVKVEAIFVTPSYVAANTPGVDSSPIFLINERQLQEVSQTDTPPGILALARMVPAVEPSFWFHQRGCLLAFDEVQDPGNLGTMIRSAAWFGMSGLLLGQGTTDLWSAKVVRSTAGATGSLPYAMGPLATMLEELEVHGWQPVLLDADASSTPLHRWTPHQATILVLGNEARGINNELLKRYPRLMIEGHPGLEAAESLNVSVAASIAMYHWFTHSP
jgi:TrmH family RNA methyltransferase